MNEKINIETETQNQDLQSKSDFEPVVSPRLSFEDEQKRIFVLDQMREAKKEIPTMITCRCGVKRPIRFMFRCYYCGEFLCDECAGKHFGQTREEYLKEKNAG